MGFFVSRVFTTKKMFKDPLPWGNIGNANVKCDCPKSPQTMECLWSNLSQKKNATGKFTSK